MKHLLIDYGGTNFRYVVVKDLKQKIDEKSIVKLPSHEVDLRLFLKDFATSELDSIRIAFAGQVKEGVIHSSPNTDLQECNLQDFVDKLFLNTKLYIQNDLNCAALAEYEATKSQNLGVFYIGTGFGMSAVIKGNVIEGAHNIAGEIGHLSYKKSSTKCICGKNDCIELFCSGAALMRRCHRVDTNLSYYNLQELQKSSDRRVVKIYDDFIQALQKALQTALTLYDFDTIVFGGSVFLHNLFLKEIIQKQLSNLPFAKQRNVTILTSSLREGALEGTRFLQ
jgi:glucokinase